MSGDDTSPFTIHVDDLVARAAQARVRVAVLQHRLPSAGHSPELAREVESAKDDLDSCDIALLNFASWDRAIGEVIARQLDLTANAELRQLAIRVRHLIVNH